MDKSYLPNTIVLLCIFCYCPHDPIEIGGPANHLYTSSMKTAFELSNPYFTTLFRHSFIYTTVEKHDTMSTHCSWLKKLCWKIRKIFIRQSNDVENVISFCILTRVGWILLTDLDMQKEFQNSSLSHEPI